MPTGEYKIEANAIPTLTTFENMAFARGTMGMDRHKFFNKIKETAGQALTLKQFLGGTLPKVEDGARIPMNKITNNPVLTNPTITGMKYFGQSPLFKMAMDQLIPKKLGVFPTGTSGAGMGSFDFTNNPLFSGETSLQSIIGSVLFGSQGADIKDGHQLFNTLTDFTKTIGDPTTKINPSSSTDLPSLLPMLAAGFGGGNTNLFDSSIFSDGMTMAKEVSDYIKKQAY